MYEMVNAAADLTATSSRLRFNCCRRPPTSPKFPPVVLTGWGVELGFCGLAVWVY